MAALNYAGIDIVTLANNHFIDFGEGPANLTIEYLKKFDVQYVGVTYGKSMFVDQEPLIITEKGIKIGFLAYCSSDEGCLQENYRDRVSTGPAIYDKTLAIREAKRLRKVVDIIVVLMHWGVEYAKFLPKYHGEQVIVQLSPYVDVIIGSHPHVVQDHFYNDGALVVQSVGNMLFPLHGSVMNKFLDKGENISRPDHDKVWYKQTKLLKNPTSFGKLIMVEINKAGIIRAGTKYLPIEIDVTKQHCLVVKKKGSWKTICDKNDKHCVGTNDCNMLHCGGVQKVKPKKKKGKGKLHETYKNV
ncbi:capsule biosynthesis protein CapA-like [Hydractinia symbiolongicarpus]|uniref:capsule biosynthesis protein CapA-like n=1 Tax=Hydractinia symbiolongicarpus TaxID=13093 RepID=UPI00254A90D6|nr:capsule biosynthesis protein CapA-like [Hydractinia symbiolongicarpus]